MVVAVCDGVTHDGDWWLSTRMMVGTADMMMAVTGDMMVGTANVMMAVTGDMMMACFVSGGEMDGANW